MRAKRTVKRNLVKEVMLRREREARSVPTGEEFARAKAYMAAELKICGLVRKAVLTEFRDRAPLHDIYIFGRAANGYSVHVFYESDADIQKCQANGIERLLEQSTTRRLAKANAEFALNLPVSFQFDSHEKVLEQCNGNYDKYLR